MFDGHAGVEAANYAAAHVPDQFVRSCLFPCDPADALKAAFKSTDEKFIEKATREVHILDIFQMPKIFYRILSICNPIDFKVMEQSSRLQSHIFTVNDGSMFCV